MAIRLIPRILDGVQAIEIAMHVVGKELSVGQSKRPRMKKKLREILEDAGIFLVLPLVILAGVGWWIQAVMSKPWRRQ